MALVMTAIERAMEIASLAQTMSFEQLKTAIHHAIIEGSNLELEKRRHAEAQLANVKNGGPLIVCDSGRASLRVWNEVTKTWWETNLIEMASKIL